MIDAIPPPAIPDPPFDIVFLDRDGTINTRLPGYVTDPTELDLLPGVGEGVASLNRLGVRVVLVTNQRGLATGIMQMEQLQRVHSDLQRRLSLSGGWLDAIFVCPHEEGACDCRKPAPGLFMHALKAAPWADASRCAMVGDMVSDVEPAAALGMRTILLGPVSGANADWEMATSLPEALKQLLSTRPMAMKGPSDVSS